MPRQGASPHSGALSIALGDVHNHGCGSCDQARTARQLVTTIPDATKSQRSVVSMLVSIESRCLVRAAWRMPRTAQGDQWDRDENGQADCLKVAFVHNALTLPVERQRRRQAAPRWRSRQRPGAKSAM